MANKLLSVTVKGKNHTWSFNFYGDPKHVAKWRDDGLEIDVIFNVIPVWVKDLGLTKVWCFFQDIFHFKNPFK